MTTNTTLRHCLLMEEDHDVCDTVYDKDYPALCGPIALTPKACEIYERILDLPVSVEDGLIIVSIDDNTDDDEELDELSDMLYDFLAVLAGYCSEALYEEMVSVPLTYKMWEG